MCLVVVLYERILNPDSEEEVRVGVCVFSGTDVCLHGCGNPRDPSLSSRPLTHSNSFVPSASELQQPEQASADSWQLPNQCVRKTMRVCTTGVTQSTQGGQRLKSFFFVTIGAFLFSFLPVSCTDDVIGQ